MMLAGVAHHLEPRLPVGYGRAMLASRCSILCLGALVLTACPGPREEDALEPNDTLEEAYRLTLEEPVEGRVNEGNPDIFVVAVEDNTQLRFELTHRKHERCPIFNVQDPFRNELLGQDPTGDCVFPLEATRLVLGATIDPLDNGDYIITVPAEAAGDYFLTIREDTVSDNVAPFGWDYIVTATIDP